MVFVRPPPFRTLHVGSLVKNMNEYNMFIFRIEMSETLKRYFDVGDLTIPRGRFKIEFPTGPSLFASGKLKYIINYLLFIKF